MKKLVMILTALVPAVVLSILATIFLPMIFGDAITGGLSIIMIAFALVTIGITIVIFIRKRGSK